MSQKTIELYLMEGKADGRWQAWLSNWNGRAYKIPHEHLKYCAELSDLNAPGVYFLFGWDDANGKWFIYIGEADDVWKRLLQTHTFEKDGSYWTEAVIFVTPDGTLDKGRVKYLENRFYELAIEAGNYLVKNANTPKQSPLPEHIKSMLEEFIINAILILPVLGYKAFVPSPSSDKSVNKNQSGLLYFSRNNGKGGKAAGRIRSDGFWVLKGSYIYPQVAEYAPPGIKKARADHAASISKEGILLDDLCFGSPSYASAFVCGKNSNGLTEWKNADGVPLKALDATSEQTSTTAVSESKPSQAAPAKKSPQTASDKSVNKSQSGLLYFSRNGGKGGKATGRIRSDGFWVLKGSYIYPQVAEYAPSGIKKARADHAASISKEGILLDDLCFGSPSYASAFVCGKNSNGLTEWKNADGVPLRELASASKPASAATVSESKPSQAAPAKNLRKPQLK